MANENNNVQYPNRANHFAHKFTRLLTRACVANDIGQDATLMLIIIVHTEDAKKYHSAVTYWNEQLSNVCGFANVKSMDRARTRAVESGWLHYEQGGRTRPGRYWVTVPKGSVEQDSGSAEDDFNPVSLVINDQQNGIETGLKREGSGDSNGIETGLKREGSGVPSTQDTRTQDTRTQEHSASPNGESVNEPPRKDKAYSESFQRWYEQYPRKTAKHKAAEAYPKAIRRIADDKQITNEQAQQYLMEATSVYAASPAGKSGQYTPHPATWLNTGRYDDDRREWQRGTTNTPQQANRPPEVTYPKAKPMFTIEEIQEIEERDMRRRAANANTAG